MCSSDLKGYDTMLGPQGLALSGGQRQRIALARAFFGRPRIVVLDEPNASLDNEGEQALVAALIEARQAGITAVVITQRTSIMPALTRLMVLREGRIEAFGPKDEVLKSQIHPAPRSATAAAFGTAAPPVPNTPAAAHAATPQVIAPRNASVSPTAPQPRSTAHRANVAASMPQLVQVSAGSGSGPNGRGS